MSGHALFNTPRRYCEYSHGSISRKYLTRTLADPRHDIRTDRIGSRHHDWRRKDTLDLQCSTQHTNSLTRDREDELWGNDPRNRHGVDPLANIVGWYSGHIDQTAWLGRKVRCYRRTRPASRLRSERKHTALHQAYHKAKAQREAQEGDSANVLTENEQSRLRANGNDANFLIMAEEKRKADAEAAKQKDVREDELKSILATLATIVPPPVQPPNLEPPQIHPDRLAQMAPAKTDYRIDAINTKKIETRAEGQRRLELKARRAKAKSQGRVLEDEQQQQNDPRGEWHSFEYELV